MSDKFRLFTPGWDKHCLFGIKTGDMLLVRWLDGTETWETAQVGSDEVWGQEQGTFLGDSYQGTYYELCIARKYHGKTSVVNVGGLSIYAECMDGFEARVAEEERKKKAERERTKNASSCSVIISGG